MSVCPEEVTVIVLGFMLCLILFGFSFAACYLSRGIYSLQHMVRDTGFKRIFATIDAKQPLNSHVITSLLWWHSPHRLPEYINHIPRHAEQALQANEG